MNIGSLFTTALYEPFLNGLLVLYRFLGGDLGLAIISLTILIKLLLFYPTLSQLRAQKKLQETQPKMKELQERFKGDKEGYQKALMEFYKTNKVNPFASCLPLLIQLPILIALYRVFITGVAVDATTGLLATDQLQHLYGSLREYFATNPITTTSFGFLNLANKNNIILALLAGAATYWQSKMLMAKQPPKKAGEGAKDEGMMASMNKNMAIMTPLLTFFFTYTFPAGLGLYWLVSTLFQLGQQYLFLHQEKKSANVT